MHESTLKSCPKGSNATTETSISRGSKAEHPGLRSDIHSSQPRPSRLCYTGGMPNRLHRYYRAGYSHFITTSCYQRLPLLGSAGFFLEPGWMRSPPRKRSIACCETPASRRSNFFGKRFALCIITKSAGRVSAVLRREYLTGPTLSKIRSSFRSVDFRQYAESGAGGPSLSLKIDSCRCQSQRMCQERVHRWQAPRPGLHL